MKKNNSNNNVFVYSTDPNFSYGQEEENAETLLPQEQMLRVWLETKHRAGKAASIVAGFVGNEGDLKELGKRIKNFCGTGGTVKDREIIIQGDHRDKIMQWLQKEGYKQSKKAGG